MSTALYTHPACLAHDMGPFHPESPSRLHAVMQALKSHEFHALERRQGKKATKKQIERVHPLHHIETILAPVQKNKIRRIDADTALCCESGDAALHASGAVCHAVDDILGQTPVQKAFVATRPPGHHAERQNAMGFCLFNHIAVGALHAHETYGLNKIAIVDFDVHHGNGTQDIFSDHPDFLYISSHQSPCYPGSGPSHERGRYNNIMNHPLPPGTGSAAFRELYKTKILPALARYKPQMIFVSAGFDAHAQDPLAQLNLQADDYAWLTGELVEIADRYCQKRLVSVLEGGYDLQALADSVALHVKTLMTQTKTGNSPHDEKKSNSNPS